LLEASESFDFGLLDTAFTLIVKQASQALDQLRDRKDPDTLDVFFIKTIELFTLGACLATRACQLENAHKSRLMALDAHKLRIIASKGVDEDAIAFAFECVDEMVREFPEDGRFWFQHAIIHASFSEKVTTFKSLNSLSRALLALQNPIDAESVASLVRKRIHSDFGNTLLCLVLKDFDDFVLKGLESWSFVKYFQSFTSTENEVKLLSSETASFLLFVLAFYKCSHNTFHLSVLVESWLNSRNQSLINSWPFVVYSLLRLCLIDGGKVAFNDAIWFRIFQLMKSEESVLATQSLSSEIHFKGFFSGTILECSSLPFYDFDFDEELSLERDCIVTCIAEEFFKANQGPFRTFITMRLDRTIRIGSYFINTEEEEEEEKDPVIYKSNEKYPLDGSIENLRLRLANISASQPPVPIVSQNEDVGLDYFKSNFILDTNVLLSAAPLIKIELTANPEKFIIPLIVLHELSRVHTSTSERSDCAKEMLEFLNSETCSPLLNQIQVLDNRGIHLESLEDIFEQLKIMRQTRKSSISSDDTIIKMAQLYAAANSFLPKPILITDDVNMRLKAKSKGVICISLKEFKTLCNC